MFMIDDGMDRIYPRCLAGNKEELSRRGSTVQLSWTFVRSSPASFWRVSLAPAQ